MTETTQQCPPFEMSELCADLPSSVCTDIVAMACPRDYMCRDVIFLMDDPIKETLLLTDGRAKITQLSEDGTEVILRLVAPGEVIGDFGLVPECKYSSAAYAINECKVLAWDAETFEEALDRFPILRRNAIRILQRRLDEQQIRFREVSTKRTSPRLAYALLCLIEQEVHKMNSNVEISITQQSLAQMTAMSKFTVNRLLTDWENQGLLRVRREMIEIPSFLKILGLCKAI